MGENGLFQSVLLKEVVIEPNVKLEIVPKFCYLGETLGAGGGSKSQSEMCLGEVQGVISYPDSSGCIIRSYRIKGKIYKIYIYIIMSRVH